MVLSALLLLQQWISVDAKPQLVRISDFLLTISPTDRRFTMGEARRIRDEAQGLLEDFFKDNVLEYDSIQLKDIHTIHWHPDELYNLIHVKGGSLYFSEDSVPSRFSVETWVKQVLDPNGDGSTGLAERLQATEDFSFVTTASYRSLREPTPAPVTASPITRVPVTVSPVTPAPVTPSPVTPSPVTPSPVTQAPTVAPTIQTLAPVTTPAPSTLAPTFSPSSTPSSQDNIPEVVKGGAPSVQSSRSSGPIVGIAAAVGLLGILAALVVRRKRQQKTYWHETHPHEHPEQFCNSDVESSIVVSGLQNKDSLNKTPSSEAGSSRLGRLLTATAAAVVRPSNRLSSAGSEGTPQASSSEEEASSSDEFSDFDGTTAVVVEPIIVPVDSLEERHPDWPPGDAVEVVDGDFRQDDSWNFNDNDDDSEADPFRSAQNTPISDRKLLLQPKQPLSPSPRVIV